MLSSIISSGVMPEAATSACRAAVALFGVPLLRPAFSQSTARGYANGANAKPTGPPASVSRQGRVCDAGNRIRHCELDPVGRAVVVHSRQLRGRSGEIVGGSLQIWC